MQHDNLSIHSGSISSNSLWVVGPTRSGRTTHLVEQFQGWSSQPGPQRNGLVFAASTESRLELVDRLSPASASVQVTTPLGFFEAEVRQYWPLLKQQLDPNLNDFPLRLRPETEQALAFQLWQPMLEAGQCRGAGVSSTLLMQRLLDLQRLAAASGTPHQQIPLLLAEGFGDPETPPELWQEMGSLIDRWWHWCLSHGLATSSMVTELYWRYLLPQRTYQAELRQRYQACFADDVDEYPAAMRSVFEWFLHQKISCLLTFNPVGATRLGLGADPEDLAKLANRCRVEELPPASGNLATTWGQTVIDCLHEAVMPQLPDAIQSIQTVSKAQLLRQTAETICTAVKAGEIQPQEIAIVVPGLDEITLYSLQTMLNRQGIGLHVLNSQQPLISSPLVRALLTLLGLVYPGLGRLLDREAIAEMLVVLSQTPLPDPQVQPFPLPDSRSAQPQPSFIVADSQSGVATAPLPSSLPALGQPRIDPVRAGLLADHCFVPDPATPQLLPPESFSRWDRLGYHATQAYREILQWLTAHQTAIQTHAELQPAQVLEQAIERFLGSGLSLDQLTLLQKLLETARHCWEVEIYLHPKSPAAAPVGRLIQLLRSGTITASPVSARLAEPTDPAVTLATIYQYRNHRQPHRWQFWLDAGSPLWLTGAVMLYGAPLFLQNFSSQHWTTAEILAMNQSNLEREVLDLLGRVTERVYLCHCDLGVNGQEQSGALMPLVNAALPVAQA